MLALVCSVTHVRDSPVRTRSSKWTNIFPSAFSVIFRVLAYRWRSRFENNSEQLGLEGELWRWSNKERGGAFCDWWCKWRLNHVQTLNVGQYRFI